MSDVATSGGHVSLEDASAPGRSAGRPAQTRVGRGDYWVVTATVGLALSLTPMLYSEATPIAAAVPLLLVAAATRGRALGLACFAGILITIYGAAGEVSYLGVTRIDGGTVALATSFAALLACGTFIGSHLGSREVPEGAPLRASLHVALGAVACIALLLRFRNGVPLLQGNEARLLSVSGENPYIGLASGVIPIAFAFIRGGGRQVWFLRGAVLLLGAGTGSRLLLAALVVGMLPNLAPTWSRATTRSRVVTVAAAMVGLWLVLLVYSYRTSEVVAGAYEQRASVLTGVAGTTTDVLGPSLYYGSRNGLSVYQLMRANGLHPPGGFVTGGVGNVFRLNADPERWLSEALGLDVTVTGAIATPLWSGAARDFGEWWSLAFALVAGCALAVWVRWLPTLQAWASFALVLSFYGSYLVSVQFLFASGILTAILVAARGHSELGGHGAAAR